MDWSLISGAKMLKTGAVSRYQTINSIFLL